MDELPEPLVDYFRSKGGLGILAVLSHGNKTYSELEHETHISGSTLSKRLDEASLYHLVGKARGVKNGRRVDLYQLTDLGARCVEPLRREGYVTAYVTMVKHRREMKEIQPEVIDIYKNNPEEYVLTGEERSSYFILEDHKIEETGQDPETPKYDKIGESMDLEGGEES